MSMLTRSTTAARAMLRAAENLVRLGGQRGLGITLVTQRCASLNTNVRTQLGVLFLLRTTGTHDLKAIDDWIGRHGQEAERRKVMSSIASLPRGTAWVWAPGFPDDAGTFARIAVSAPAVFDSGRTPSPGEKQQALPKTNTTFDLAGLRAELARVGQKGVAAAPVVATAPSGRTDDRERRLDEREQAAAAREERIAGRARATARHFREVEGVLESARNGIVAASRALDGVAEALRKSRESLDHVGVAPKEQNPRSDSLRHVPVEAARGGGIAPSSDLRVRGPKGERSMLHALRSVDPMPLVRKQLATIAGLSSESGSFSTYLARLRSAELIGEQGDGFVLTPKGRDLCGECLPRTAKGVIETWLGRLPAGAQRIFREVERNTAMSPLSRGLLAELTALSPESGSFSTYLGLLTSNGLIERRGNGYALGSAIERLRKLDDEARP